MKHKKQRIALVAVLVLAGGALAVDHFITGPSAAPAATLEVAAQTAKTPADPAAAAIAPAPVADVLSEKLAALSASTAQSSGPDDAFIMPAAWTSVAFPPPDPPPVIVAAAEKSAAEEAKFTLSSIVNASDPTLSAARINNRLISVGEKINGYALVEVGVNSDNTCYALLRGPKGTVTVSIKPTENTRPDLADAETPAADPSPK